MRATVSEIHGHPLRPEGFEEPLFPTRESRRAVAEHLRESSSWLSRACEAGRGGDSPGGDSPGSPSEATGTGAAHPKDAATAHRKHEPVGLVKRTNGRIYLVRREVGVGSTLSGRDLRVVEVLDRWREVGRWWEGGGGSVDRLCFRLLLEGKLPGDFGAVVDLALEKGSKAWLLVGLVD